jgi:CheY-like chemotaxis protein
VHSEIVIVVELEGRRTRKPAVSTVAGRDRASDASQRTPTVLVVDDEPSNLKLAKIVLNSEGFDVKVATDAISAFEVLKTCDPDVIVMDVQLPGMDGWELTRRLKRNLATSHIPVIALTAYGTKGDEERARDAQCAAYYASR